MAPPALAEDRNVERLDVAEKILINTPAGDSLYSYVSGFYGAGSKYGDSLLKKTLLPFQEIAKDKSLDRYFRKVPTHAARTILSKFQLDLLLIKLNLVSTGIGAFRDSMLSE